MQNEKPIIHINYEIEVDQVMEEKEIQAYKLKLVEFQDYVKELTKKRLTHFGTITNSKKKMTSS